MALVALIRKKGEKNWRKPLALRVRRGRNLERDYIDNRFYNMSSGRSACKKFKKYNKEFVACKIVKPETYRKMRLKELRARKRRK